MKRWIICLVAAILAFTLAACQTPSPDPTIPPGESGPSKPTATEPPELKILDSTCMGLEALKGTYSWMYDTGNGHWTAVAADSLHPLQSREYLIPMETASDAVTLSFDVQPQEITVRCWRDVHFGNAEASEEYLDLDGNTLSLKEGGYIYEICASWTGENLAAAGTAHYSFYAIRRWDDHTHGPAADPQTVEDPYSGYCGNTMTTITLDGKQYSFDGSDSVYLTDLLLNLHYDPIRVCRCAPEFEVTTEFGGPYGVSLSSAYARCDMGQADLTPEQIAAITRVLENAAAPDR